MTKERSGRKKREAAAEAAAAAVATAPSSFPAAFNGGAATTELPSSWRGWPRPETYFGGPYGNAYDWSHTWPAMRADATFGTASAGGAAVAADFGSGTAGGGGAAGFPRPAYPYAVPPPPPHSASPAAARGNSDSANSDSGKSQSEGSSASGEKQQQHAQAQQLLQPHQQQQQQRKRRRAAEKGKGKQQQQQQVMPATGVAAPPVEEGNAKNKRYSIDEIRDLVRFRMDLSARFETSSMHLELWQSIGEKMGEKGHPKRQWESYRDKWDIEFRRYQKELKNMLGTGVGGAAECKDSGVDNPEQLVFSDEVLQEIHKRVNTRPKSALRSRFQSGAGGARGCLDDGGATMSGAAAMSGGAAISGAAREVAGKRMKKTANNQLLVDSIVDKVAERLGSFEDTAMAAQLKEVLDAVLHLTNVISSDAAMHAAAMHAAASSAAAAVASVAAPPPAQAAAPPPQQHPHFSEALEIDDKVFTWLKGIGKEQYAGHFAAAHVDWCNLMLLDREDLVEMKVPLGPRKFILRELDKIRPEPLYSSGGAAQQQQQQQQQQRQQQQQMDSENDVLEQQEAAEAVV